MWDPTPWAVGGGAQHSPEVARTAVYSATAGAEGIGASGDLRVVPMDTPGAGVRVLPGSALVLSRYVGGTQQTYTARLPAADTVGIQATGSGPQSARSDLIVARIEDPFAADSPYDEPADPATAQYIFTRVIAGVPAGTTRLQSVPGHENDSAITLARIDLPPSTGTVTLPMIVDLRRIAAPRSRRLVLSGSLPASPQDLTASAFITWPSTSFMVDVPDWAVDMTVRIETLAGHQGPNVDGQFRAELDTLVIATQRYNYDLPSGQAQRVPVLVAGGAQIRSLAGRRVPLRLRGLRSSGSSSGRLHTLVDAYYVADVQFYEEPV